ncbi:MAG: hypothetical protein GXO48_05045 [Chlorobi bacterium]|nr:hypothetical protein [Chlorobiota bacterium]
MKRVKVLCLFCGAFFSLVSLAQNVGIGTSNPTAFLHVNALGSNTKPVLLINQGSDTLVVVLPSGRIGFLTSNPTHSVHIKGAVRLESLSVPSGGVVATDNAGVLLAIPFSGDSTDYLSGSGSWKPVPSGDNWGSQVVVVDSPLTGDGTTTNPLGIIGSSIANVVLFWDGTKWQLVPIDSVFWTVRGNTGLPSYFLGTINPIPLRLFVDSQITIVFNPNMSVQRSDSGSLRGSGALDLQVWLNSLGGALGDTSTISGGAFNTVFDSAYSSVISGGTHNYVASPYSFIGSGYDNKILKYDSGFSFNSIISGRSNVIDSLTQFSSIHSGDSNYINYATHSHIIGGRKDTILGGYYGRFLFIGVGENLVIKYSRNSAILSGTNNMMRATSYSLIASGFNNRILSISPIYSYYNVINGGANNTISVRGTGLIIGGGSNNTIEFGTVYYGSILGGTGNKIRGSGFMRGPVIVGGYNNTLNRCEFAFIGTGYGNNTVFSCRYGFIGTGSRNVVRGEYGVVLSGDTNTADKQSLVGSGTFNRIFRPFSSIITGDSNYVIASYSVIGSGKQNAIGGWYNFIGTGSRDTIYLGMHNVIATGDSNAIRGDNNAIVSGKKQKIMGNYSFIATGYENLLDLGSDFSVILTGLNNYVKGDHSILIGGREDTIIGSYSAILGGYNNVVVGSGSIAAGMGARAAHSNTFVWSDDLLNKFSSTASRQFLIKARRGVGVNTDSPRASMEVSYFSSFSFPQLRIHSTTPNGFARIRFSSLRNSGGNERLWDIAALAWDSTLRFYAFGTTSNVMILSQVGNRIVMNNGAYLSAGGVWTNASSRQFKENIEPLNPDSILKKFMLIPVYSWTYRNTNERHIGPMAEDFNHYFLVGNPDDSLHNKSLAALDIAGVTMAVTQQLYQQIENLKEENYMLKKQYEELLKRINALEQEMQQIKNKTK